MKKHNYSDFENYILMADKCNINQSYSSFLDFRRVVSFVKDFASKTGDTFLHNGTIYKKRITSNEARKFLDGLVKNYCDVATLKKVANQLKIKI